MLAIICFSIVGASLGVLLARAKTTGEAIVALIGIIAAAGAALK